MSHVMARLFAPIIVPHQSGGRTWLTAETQNVMLAPNQLISRALFTPIETE